MRAHTFAKRVCAFAVLAVAAVSIAGQPASAQAAAGTNPRTAHEAAYNSALCKKGK